MNKDQIILDFFNFEVPCPEHIPSCEELRTQYRAEVNTLAKTGCSGCKQNALKSKYINKIWELYVTSNL
jgi:hypothetical protein